MQKSYDMIRVTVEIVEVVEAKI